MRARLRLAAAFVLSALLAASGGRARARDEAEAFTDEERRGAGEFLLRLDERWRDARDFGALFDEAFVGDYLETQRGVSESFPLFTVEEPLRAQLTPADERRAHLVCLDVIYVAGRLTRAFELREQGRKAAERAATAVVGRDTAADGGEPRPEEREEEDSETAFAEMLSPPVVEVFRSNPMVARAVLEEGRGGQGGGDEDSDIRTFEEFDAVLSTFERALPLMRARVWELEAGLPGAPLSSVGREDDGDGEWPDLRLTVRDEEWMNRPAGTRVVCAYVSFLHVDLVKEGGRYRVLAAYVED